MKNDDKELFSSEEENTQPKEQYVAKENKKVDENKDYIESYNYTQEDEDRAIYRSKAKTKREKINKTSSAVSKTVSTLALSTSAILLTTAVVSTNTTFLKKDPKYQVNNISVSQNTISYDIDIIDDNDYNMTLVFTSLVDQYTVEPVENAFKGELKDLPYLTEYKVTLKGEYKMSKKNFYQTTITTEKKIRMTQFISFDYENNIFKDGTIMLKIIVRDDYDYYQDYSISFATLDDSDESLHHSFALDDVETKPNQSIDVSTFPAGQYRVTINCQSGKPEDVLTGMTTWGTYGVPVELHTCEITI